MNSRTSFDSRCDVSVIDLPAAGVDHVFAADRAGSRALTIEVVVDGASAWTASFAAPEPGIHALSEVLGTPRATALCVVERGTAFLGDALRPAGFEAIKTRSPIVGARQLLDEALLLLVTPSEVIAIDTAGVRWSTERIAVDGLRLAEVNGEWITGIADPDDDQPHPFSIELATGRVLGGVDIGR